MTEYKYVFGSLRDERVIAEIPLSGTYMDLELNAGGRFDGTFWLDTLGDTEAEKRTNNRMIFEDSIVGYVFFSVFR
jgi:hypothetical protein